MPVLKVVRRHLTGVLTEKVIVCFNNNDIKKSLEIVIPKGNKSTVCSCQRSVAFA